MDILIVDDDGEDRDLFCHALNEVLSDTNCVWVKSGYEALTFLRHSQFKPQYIFLDIYMQGMDGKECLLKIKSIKSFIRTPVIMYSANNNEQEQSIYKKLGANGFIEKGVHSEIKVQLLKLFKN